jgi:anti-anti-sigma factor
VPLVFAAFSTRIKCRQQKHVRRGDVMSKTSRWMDPQLKSASAARRTQSSDESVLYVDGPLDATRGGQLREKVQAKIHHGVRTIVVSLARVSAIDAAGIGELVRTYNMTVAAGGIFRITDVPARVRETLEPVGLFEVLSSAR